MQFILGILLLLAGICGPAQHRPFRGMDGAALFALIAAGFLLILYSVQKGSKEKSAIYTMTFTLEQLPLLNGATAVVQGEQLYFRLYAGEAEEDVAILTDKAVALGIVPLEYREHVADSLEHHRIVHAVVEALQFFPDQEEYSVTIRVTC